MALKAFVDRFNLILGCPYDHEMMGVVSKKEGTRVPIAALYPHGGIPTVKKLDVLRCSECQRTFIVSSISKDPDFGIYEVSLLEG